MKTVINKIILFGKVLKFNRVFNTSFEFMIGYLLSIYIFKIHFDTIIFLKAMFTYFVLFGLIYPIVYIYNDICDLEKDKLSKDKLKYKPLASGKISLEKFIGYGIFAIGLGLILSFWSSKIFILFFGIAILFNYFYTNYLKHIFIIENFANAFTHSFIRFGLGLILPFYNIIKGTIDIVNAKEILSGYNYYIILIYLLILLHFIYWSLGSLYKRYIEYNINKESRNTLKRYTKGLFIRLIIIFNLSYFLLYFFLVYYTNIDIILFIMPLLFIIFINLSLLYGKNNLLDKILNHFILG